VKFYVMYLLATQIKNFHPKNNTKIVQFHNIARIMLLDDTVLQLPQIVPPGYSRADDLPFTSSWQRIAQESHYEMGILTRWDRPEEKGIIYHPKINFHHLNIISR